jgi:hypothetical protein
VNGGIKNIFEEKREKYITVLLIIDKAPILYPIE